MTINQKRIFKWNPHPPNLEGEYVLYWMQINRRIQYNFALEYAVASADQYGKPLLIYEALKSNYPWASDRFHQFIIEGMMENRFALTEGRFNVYTYLEQKPGDGKGLVQALCKNACLIVTDDFPVFVIQEHNEQLGPNVSIPYISVDSNGVIPFGLSVKAPYSAYEFRRLMQKNFVEAFHNPPQKEPLAKLKNTTKIKLSQEILKRWRDADLESANIHSLLSNLPIDHSVSALPLAGTRKAALGRLKSFVKKHLEDYGELRNHPDLNKSSGLSPYLHFGKISVFEVVQSVLKKQPVDWRIEQVKNRNGSREGFFNGHPYVDSFLDELITWRETGYHYCHHVKNFDQFESLPEWARKTLEKHVSDTRDPQYTLEQLEGAQTYDALWNAAQRQLLREGTIHNYLRMLWAKKILEWTPDPRSALQILIHLNNKYSIDGRNPNSYTGIFWTLGRFDRPWAPERNIFGTIRYMSSENTARKAKVKEYLKKYGAQE